MKLGVVAAVAFGCGRPVVPEPTMPPPPVAAFDKPPPDFTPERFCDRFAVLVEQDCAGFARVEMTHDECLAQFRSALHDRSEDTRTWRCVVDNASCGDVLACFAALGPDAEHLRACDADDDGNHAIGVPRTDWDHRNGLGVTRFSQAHSSRDAPIEVCTTRAEHDWLTALRCDDDSRPISGRDAAQMARLGEVGHVGRCRSLIELYRVRCPEATYDLYVDGAICPLPK